MDHSVSSSNSSARKSLARAWLGTFTNWDFNTMYSLMTEAPDFHYGYLPTSVGLTPKSRSQWQTYNTFMKDVLPDFNVLYLFLSHLLILCTHTLPFAGHDIRSPWYFWSRTRHCSRMFHAPVKLSPQCLYFVTITRLKARQRQARAHRFAWNTLYSSTSVWSRACWKFTRWKSWSIAGMFVSISMGKIWEERPLVQGRRGWERSCDNYRCNLES